MTTGEMTTLLRKRPDDLRRGLCVLVVLAGLLLAPMAVAPELQKQKIGAGLVGAALDAAFEGGQQVALLLSQRLIGRKKWIAK